MELASCAGRRFIASFSGGKDSTLSIHRAIAAGMVPAGLVTTWNMDMGRSWFHGLPDEVLNALSAAWRMPIALIRTNGPDYAANFEQHLWDARTNGVELCVFGDIDLEPHRNGVPPDVKRQGWKPVFPCGRKTGRRWFMNFWTWVTARSSRLWTRSGWARIFSDGSWTSRLWRKSRRAERMHAGRTGNTTRSRLPVPCCWIRYHTGSEGSSGRTSMRSFPFCRNEGRILKRRSVRSGSCPFFQHEGHGRLHTGYICGFLCIGIPALQITFHRDKLYRRKYGAVRCSSADVWPG